MRISKSISKKTKEKRIKRKKECMNLLLFFLPPPVFMCLYLFLSSFLVSHVILNGADIDDPSVVVSTRL